ncbi:hypothetical protein B0H16DRAFT_1896801 [Mycena metata]|uniref:C2H2-type domain-containing protein n=1 Tax=Mycena metata TaxID=1033252 RepID=A0AAD7HHC8_9AGAR|nr:hypothetical protein B0H16DRAFT_1896801 [Mycena metata]
MDASYNDNTTDDVDAEGEMDGDGHGHDAGGGMTLVEDAGGLANALGLSSPSSTANASANATANAGASGGSALAGGGVGKRYRPAPAKTFQCRGYGECRMVFSRSEHLARHVRKHTGERPFTCHCSKQFSRLDNLRQHAQTVHADKAAENEAMMRELTSLHAAMTSGSAPLPIAATTTTTATSPTSTNGNTGTNTGTGNASGDGTSASAEVKTSDSPPPANTNTASNTGTSGKRPAAKRPRASGGAGAGVKREPVEDVIGLRQGPGKPRPGTSTGYEGAAAGAGMGYRVSVTGREEEDGDVDMDREPHHPKSQRQEPSPPLGGRNSFRGDSAQSQQSFRAPESFRGEQQQQQQQQPSPIGTLSSSFRPATADHAGFRAAGDGFRGGGGERFDAQGRYEQGREREREGRERPGTGAGTGTRSFLGGGGGGGNNNSHSGGSGQSFRGPQFVRRSPPTSTPSPPTPLLNGNGILAHRASGSFSSGRPFSSGNGAFPASNADTFPSGGSFPGSSGGGPFFSSSRPSTGSGARLPPLSAVVPAAAFRPASGHGLPAPGSAGGILLPNSLTLRRPSTSDWEWGDAWSVRPGTAPGNLATAPVDDSPFSFHPPEQPTTTLGVGALGSGNSRKRTFGGPDGPYGAHPDDGDGSGGGYEYGSESRPTSRRFSVMELCNDDTPEQRPASSFGLSVLRGGSAKRESEQARPTTTNGLISRASALVLHDRDQQQQWELESRQHASEQRFAADPFAAATGGGGFGGARSRPGSALEQAQADAEMAAYHQRVQEAEQAQQVHFYHQQQQMQEQERRIEEERYQEERRIEEERYHLEQLHQQAYYPHPHPQQQQHALEMDMALGMEMMEGYSHPPHMPPLDMEAVAGGYHTHHPPHIEAVASPVLDYLGDSQEYHHAAHPHHPQPQPYPHPTHHHPPPIETNPEQTAVEVGSPVSPYSLGYPHTPLAAYPYGETMPSLAYSGSMNPGYYTTRPEDRVKFESSQLDADLGLSDMNMSMNMSMGLGIGLGVGGAG